MQVSALPTIFMSQPAAVDQHDQLDKPEKKRKERTKSSAKGVAAPTGQLPCASWRVLRASPSPSKQKQV